MLNALTPAACSAVHPFLGASGLKLLALLVVLVPLLIQAGCGEGPIAAKGLPLLRQNIDKEIGDYEKSAKAICGVYIIDLRDGKTITELRIDDKLKPGSNMKLLTSAFVLAELGPDFAFTTSVYRRGDDIVVVGDGDSTLGAPELSAETGEGIYAELDRWAEAVTEKVGASFAGDLIICSQFDLSASRPPGWAEHIYRFAWAPATGGLNYHGNLLDVTLTVADGKVAVEVKPETRFFKVVNKLIPGEKTEVTLNANEDDSVFELTGTVKGSSRKPERFPIHHPELFTGRVLAERLVAIGVSFKGKVRYIKSSEIDLGGAQLLHRKKTPLAASMKWMNIRSLNMPAECHYLRAGDMTWEGTPEALTKSLIENYGMKPGTFAVDEGSGISAVDRVTPRGIMRLLKAFLTVDGGQLVVESIPRSGTEGTMSRDLVEPEYRGRVRGKIGHVLQGYCLSGYILNKEGEPVMVYSIMANEMPAGEETGAKPLQMAICKLLVDYVDGRK